MNTRQRITVALVLLISLVISGCGSGQLLGPTLTSTATITQTATITPTLTQIPTSTITPTATWTATPQGATLPLSLNLPADARWVDTQVLLQEGESITIIATGKVTLGKRFVNIDASHLISSLCNMAIDNQSANPKYTIDCLLTNAPGGAVIGKIGNNPPFLIGGSKHFTTTASGELFLGVNDCCVIDDNSGAYLITISTP